MPQPVEVMQEDREAAADLLRTFDGRSESTCRAMREGILDRHDYVQAFARHRQSTASPLQAGIDALAALEQQPPYLREAYMQAQGKLAGRDAALSSQGSTPARVWDGERKLWLSPNSTPEGDGRLLGELALHEAIVEQGGWRSILVMHGANVLTTYSNFYETHAPSEANWREAKEFKRGWDAARAALTAMSQGSAVEAVEGGQDDGQG